MENKVRRLMSSSMAATIACISIYLFVRHHRSRSRSRSRNSCYLCSQVKPQSSFKRVLADNSFSPFKHLPNPKSSNLHPHESEIMTLLKNPQIDYSIFNEISTVGMSKSHVWVQSEAQLQELVNVLSEEQLFAVDTEQHSLRSFLGFTALVQISTRKEDYLVDTIVLHDSIHILQSVFSDPSIVKVFHGADNDVLWLQRDFHIYVVNLFDTAKACEILSKPQKSLAYLLETYCGVTTNKLLQRGDWRQRPLPEDMVEYAQLDAHYLLYIASCLIKELEDKDKDINQPKDSESQYVRSHYLAKASRRSNATTLQLFCKESDVFPGESVASSILSRYLNSQGAPSNIVGVQFQDHIRKLCAWRDLMARVHDESLRYVLSDQAIIALAEKRPKSKGEIYKIISLAETSPDLFTSSFSATSPSLVICSHWEDIKCLLEENESKSANEILQNLLHNHLGSKGSCSLSIYNYNLLSGSNLKLANGSMLMQNGRKSGKLCPRGASRELFVQKFSCKAPVYHNCRIFASDGRLLCYCDRRKLEWYLNRNLAKLLDDDPPAIMLLFEPKGRPEDEDNDFYIQSKRNMCVSCGQTNHYLRYRVIPSCYRIHFPEHLKSHRSHDIVLLCVDCHEVAHAAAEKYKRQVAKEYGIPLYVRRVLDSGEITLNETPKSQEEGVSPLQLRTAAMALLRHGPRMPFKRREELIEIVRRYYGGREISHEDLEKALLVGMSPYERRKFEKKRGALHKKTLESTSDAVTGNDYAIDQSSCEELVNKPDTNVETPSLSASEVPDFKHASLVDSVNNYENASSSKTSGNKRNSKVSLLGHGPHGKEVVDHLLKNSGDDGIHQFCQRWRQVFVDALHPRYLPAGWDINHSGRRAFGEFSVYNPAKKAIDAIAENDQI